MISLKSLLKTVKAAKVTQPKEGVNTSLDAKIQVEGYGVMTRKQLQGSIQRYVAEVTKYLRNLIECGVYCKTESIIHDIIAGA